MNYAHENEVYIPTKVVWGWEKTSKDVQGVEEAVSSEERRGKNLRGFALCLVDLEFKLSSERTKAHQSIVSLFRKQLGNG